MTSQCKKTLVLFGLFLTKFLEGALDQHFYPENPFNPVVLAATFVVLTAVFAWFRLDAIERSFHRSARLNIAVVGLALVAIPYYLFKSRGGQRGAAATAIFLLLVVACGAVQYAGAYAAYFAAQT